MTYLFSPLANIAHGQVMRIALLLHGVYFAAGITMFLAHQSGWSRGRIAVLALCALGAYQQIRQAGQSEALGLNADLRANIAFALWLALTALLLLSMHFSTPSRGRSPAATMGCA